MKQYLVIWKFNQPIVINGGAGEAYEAVGLVLAKDLNEAQLKSLRLYKRAKTFPQIVPLGDIKKDTLF